jgi:hypothetical protein
MVHQYFIMDLEGAVNSKEARCRALSATWGYFDNRQAAAIAEADFSTP